MSIKIVKYRDKKGKVRAKVVAKNGRTLFESSEGYERRAGLDNAIIVMTKAIANAQYTVVDET